MIPVILLLFSCEMVSQSIVAEKKFDMEGIKSLEVNGSFCSVEIIGYGGSTLIFEGEIKASSDKEYSIEYDRDGDELKVWIESPRNNWGNTNGSLRFKVPSSTQVVVDNSSGSVAASGLKSMFIKLEASSGSIKARDMEGDMYLETSSGSSELEGLVGDLEIKSSSGSQSIESVVGNIAGRSSSGRIRFRNIKGDIVAETSSGGISLDDVVGGLELESTSGSLNGDRIKISNNSYFKSSSGSIRMELINDLETLNFDLKASSGSLRVGSKSADDRYIDKQGDGLKITGISSSGSQSYVN